LHNSYGQASSPIGATGIYTLTANNCYGVAISSDSSSVGISADAVLNSYGFSSGGTNGPGYGIDAITVGNSRGYSTRANSASRGILADGLVSDSFAQCDGGHAIAADYAESCRGESINGIGVRVNYSALNCVGISSNHFGLSATIANGSYGKSHFNPGIYASTIDNCYGISVAGEGISGSVVNNSYGISTSNTGISAYCSQNSKGDTATGSYGLSVYSVAIGCTGYHGGNGTGINGYILNSCWGAGTPGASATYKYNMP